MTVKLLYFAWVRENIGLGEQSLPLDAPTTIAALLERLRDSSAAHARAFAQPDRLRFALNEQVTGPESLVNPGDELAIFPPVTGGN